MTVDIPDSQRVGMLTNGKLRHHLKVVDSWLFPPLGIYFSWTLTFSALPQLFYNVDYRQQAGPWPILDPQHMYELKEATPDIHSFCRKIVFTGLGTTQSPYLSQLSSSCYRFILTSSLMVWITEFSDWAPPCELCSPFSKFSDAELKLWKVNQFAQFWDSVNSRDRMNMQVSW